MQLTDTGWTGPAYDPERSIRTQIDWREPIATIAAGLGLDFGPATMFPTGSDVVFGDGRTVIKVSRPRWTREIQTEAVFLRRVHGELPVRTPRVLALGSLEDWPFVVMDQVPGVAVGHLWAELDRSQQERVAVQVGALIRSLHALPVEADPAWATWVASCDASAPTRHRGPAHLVEEIPDFLGPAPPEPSSPVLLHTEIYEQHVLLDPDTLEIVSLIDFADAAIGDARYELPAVIELMFRDDRAAMALALDASGIDLGPEPAEELLRWSLRHRYGQLARWLEWVDGTPKSLSDLARAVA